jgi:hypothetical protein
MTTHTKRLAIEAIDQPRLQKSVGSPSYLHIAMSHAGSTRLEKAFTLLASYLASRNKSFPDGNSYRN